jgi:mannose/fructose/sorbose-specific phosphotransferase system IIA component
MAEGLLDAARMIVGEQEQVATVSLREADSIEGLMERVEVAWQSVETGDGTLLLVDAFGASPFNACARLALARDNVEVITGVNLPMLMELAIQRDTMSFSELIALALEAGKSSIRTLSETMGKQPPMDS